MFGMGGTEILVILVVALLFLGPDKLPEAAKTISKGLRDLRKTSRDLQNTIEQDTEIGGAIRDIKAALRGEEPRPRPVPPAQAKPAVPSAVTTAAIAAAEGAATESAQAAAPATAPTPSPSDGQPPAPTLPPRAGEIDEDGPQLPETNDDLRGLVRPAGGTVAKGTASDPGAGASS